MIHRSVLMGNKGRAAESRPACDGRDGERHCHPRSRRGGGRDRVSGHLWWWCSRPSCTSLSLALMAAEYSRSSNRCRSRSRSRLQRRPDHQSQHVLSSPSATEPPGRTAGNTLYTATRRWAPTVHPSSSHHYDAVDTYGWICSRFPGSRARRGALHECTSRLAGC